MTNMDLIFENEFKKSKAYKEWRDSFVNLMNMGFEPINEFLDKYTDP